MSSLSEIQINLGQSQYYVRLTCLLALFTGWAVFACALVLIIKLLLIAILLVQSGLIYKSKRPQRFTSLRYQQEVWRLICSQGELAFGHCQILLEAPFFLFLKFKNDDSSAISFVLFKDQLPKAVLHRFLVMVNQV